MPRPLVVNGQTAGHLIDEHELDFYRSLEAVIADRETQLNRHENTLSMHAADITRLTNMVAALRAQLEAVTRPANAQAAPVPVPVVTDTRRVSAVPAARSVATSATTVTAEPVEVHPQLAATIPVASVQPNTANTPPVTLDQLRTALQTFSQQHGVPSARQLLARFSSTSVSQVPENMRGEVITAITAYGVLPVAQVAQTAGA